MSCVIAAHAQFARALKSEVNAFGNDNYCEKPNPGTFVQKRELHGGNYMEL